jgi:hypothetical protein
MFYVGTSTTPRRYLPFGMRHWVLHVTALVILCLSKLQALSVVSLCVPAAKQLWPVLCCVALEASGMVPSGELVPCVPVTCDLCFVGSKLTLQFFLQMLVSGTW